MSDTFSNEPMLEMYIFETSQQLEQLEQAIIVAEKSGEYSQKAINEIFRFMHTIKGSSAMMLFNTISILAHSIEDLFYFLRESKPEKVDFSLLSDLILEGVDFIKIELEKIKCGDTPDGEADSLILKINDLLLQLKSLNSDAIVKEKPVSKKKQQYYIAPEKKESYEAANQYKAIISFQDGCEMENIRAYTIVHNLAEFVEEIFFIPKDILENDESVNYIRENGFEIYFRTDKTYDEINHYLMQTIFLNELKLSKIDDEMENIFPIKEVVTSTNVIKMPEIHDGKEDMHKDGAAVSSQSIISVNVEKLDKLMDLVGEMVIAEAMVTQNPEIIDLEIDNFQKAARQLHKITSELQDMVMAIRMVPLSTTFTKMNRIMRDMCKKLGKEVELKVIGEETEVDKNIIEHISDPLMHLIRNSIDHGIEDNAERIRIGKERVGTVTLEAKNSGSDVLVIIRDDGKGLQKEKILQKAKENDILEKNENDMTDKEIFNLILLPGFSTKEKITEFSGRGVGMDVVLKNLESVGGSVSVDSILNKGTTITLKIPLTLAIIDGMNIKVGDSRYTIPLITIKESFRPGIKECFKDPDDNEMIMVRGQCYPILRIHEHYCVKTKITEFSEGILIMVEQDEKTICLFADELIGQQQVVVKSLPNYIKSIKKIPGLAGCTLLGNGSISLILDIGGLCNLKSK